MTEQQRITGMFYKNFIENNQDGLDIIIYGIGKYTELILQKFYNSNILGILDGYKKEGFFCDKPIIALESLVGKKVKIIIVARKASERVIYRRIAEFCDKYNIPIFNLEGILLSDYYVVKSKNDPYFEKNMDDLMNEIQKHNAISFDIFDTLIARKVSTVENVYKIIEKKHNLDFEYSRVRVAAEKKVYQNKIANIYDIYDEIKNMTGISEIVAEQLMKEEIVTEKDLLFPRKEMVDAFKYAVMLKKNVTLISDMYLSADVIKEILDKNDIFGYSNLLVSCEYSVGKTEGLYDVYKNIVKSDSYLHIGDSVEADGICAEAYGIDSYLIKSPVDMYDLSLLSDIKYNEIDLLQGIRIYNLFNNPFILYKSNGELKLDDSFLIGYGILAPVLVSFLMWLIEILKKDGVEMFLFLSRDGYLLEKMYNKMYRWYKNRNICIPKSDYLLFSRSLGIAAMIEDEADIIYAVKMPFNGTPEELLKKRFQLDKTEVLDFGVNSDLVDYVMLHKEKILKRAEELRKNYKGYIEKLQIDNYEKIGLFDFVSTGTCQMCLKKILKINFDGYYFDRIEDLDEMKRNLSIKSFIKSLDDNYECDNYFLLEILIKDTVPSLLEVSSDGSVRFDIEHTSLLQQEFVKNIQKAALEFVDDFIKYSGLYEDDCYCRHYVSSNFNVLKNMTFKTLFKDKLLNFDRFTNRDIMYF